MNSGEYFFLVVISNLQLRVLSLNWVGHIHWTTSEDKDKILGLYGLGNSYRDIAGHLKELYGVEVSTGSISAITDKVIPVVKEWQQRPLDSHYPFVWLDAIHYKIRENNRYQTKAVYTVLALNLEGKKEVLGLYVSESEGANFWLSVLTDLNNRGVQDILIASVDVHIPPQAEH